MKFTYEDKLKMYDLWKNDHWSPRMIAKKFNTNHEATRHIIKLIDFHGCEIVRHDKNNYYSPEFKIEAINRILINHESASSVSIELGLPSCATLSSWIKSFQENGYTIVEKRKGRKPHDKEESYEDSRRTGERKRILTPAEPETYRRERILKKIESLSSTKRKPTKEEIARAITELRQELSCSLKFILDTIHDKPELPQITRSDYYYQLKKIDKDMKNDDIMNQIIYIFYTHKKRYGYRRITLELAHMGYQVNHKKVKRLMKLMGLYGVTPKAKYKSYKGDFNGTVKSQLLNKVVDEENHKTYYERDFTTTACNQKWTTDVTEFHIADGKVYLSPIMDMHNREIVSFDVSISPNFQQTTNMLNQAFEKYKDLSGLIFHSDQGWQYQMAQYHSMLNEKGIIQSMSRKGNCLDNSPMENFFGRMKNEMFYGHEYEFTSKEQLIQEIKDYIDYYNSERIQVNLKGLTPIQYRDQSL